ncbi:MAG: SCO family protein [Pseudomonadota bacterium]
MKIVRYSAWALVVILLAFAGYAWTAGGAGKSVMKMAGADIGGPFSLQRTDGTAISEQDLMGKSHAIFFGFTHCPEVCPTTLFEAAGWLENLGDDADKFAIYFITVDPERDTPEMLDLYMESFPGITGLSGTPEELAEVQKLYRVYSRKVPLEDGDYTVDHTATVYLMDKDGKFSGTIAYGENPDTAMEKIRKLIDT